MADRAIARRVRVSIEHGLSEREAVSLSRSARAFPCELHVNYGRRRIDAKSIVAMLDLSHELDEQAVIELEAEGKDSLQALDRLADLVRHPAVPALDELAFFGLVGNPGRYPSLTALDPRDCLRALALESGPGHPERPQPGQGPPIM